MGVSMTKILLVEDDKSLREIYGVRLLAEGYQIASAGDGEEALAMAIKEHPDLIISDVMMPKISGFDMLDILRTTPETKDLKVIMMTALSSEDQRARGESLGANRYLVKSQVGIEDVVRAVHDVLADVPVAVAPASSAFTTPTPTTVSTIRSVASTMPPAPTPTSILISIPTPMSTPQATPTVLPTPTPTLTVMPAPAPKPISIPIPMPQPAKPFSTPVTAPAPTSAPTPAPAPMGDRTINPLPSAAPVTDIATLINQELDGTSTTTPPTSQI